MLLAFADSDRSRPLPHLAQEERRIRDALDPLVSAMKIDRPVTLWNATPDRIIDEFQRDHMRGRIGVFHFGGHAGTSDVLLASLGPRATSVAAEHLAAFLGRQEGLTLVFLNGCSTAGHVDRLLEAGIKAIVSTSHSVLDDLAAELAARFYTELRARPLADAFAATRAAMAFRGTGAPRELMVDESLDEAPAGDAWQLRCDRACEAWRLGDAGPASDGLRVVPGRGRSWPVWRFSISNQTGGPVQLTEIRASEVASIDLRGGAMHATDRRVRLELMLGRAREDAWQAIFGDEVVSNLDPGRAEAFALEVQAEATAGLVDMELHWIDADACERSTSSSHVLLVHGAWSGGAGSIEPLARADALERLLARGDCDDVSSRLLARAAARLCIPDVDEGFERLRTVHERGDAWPPILASFADALADGLRAERAREHLDALVLDADRVRGLVTEDDRHFAPAIVRSLLKAPGIDVEWAFRVLDSTLTVSPILELDTGTAGLVAMHDELLGFLGEQLGRSIDEVHVARALLMEDPDAIPRDIRGERLADGVELRRWWAEARPRFRTSDAWRRHMPRFASLAVPVLDASD